MLQLQTILGRKDWLQRRPARTQPSWKLER